TPRAPRPGTAQMPYGRGARSARRRSAAGRLVGEGMVGRAGTGLVPAAREGQGAGAGEHQQQEAPAEQRGGEAAVLEREQAVLLVLGEVGEGHDPGAEEGRGTRADPEED